LTRSDHRVSGDGRKVNLREKGGGVVTPALLLLAKEDVEGRCVREFENRFWTDCAR